jgi:gamma-glutamylcyclotransferase (GGCT)/AIG2-like uncharacterized protein YtfP
MVARQDRSKSTVAKLFMDADLHVFVYGTLKPGAANFDRYCGGKVVKSQRGYTQGCLYELPSLGYPGMIHGSDRVHGFILSFNDETILPELDELEDYDPQRQPFENEYNRELVTTHTIDGIPYLSAWAYFMNVDRIKALDGILLPTGWWEGSTVF